MTAARIRKLTLTQFRSYATASLRADERPVVLVGPNGAGKTNLLEALSLLTPGRGLRRATLDEMAFAQGDGSWAVAAEVEGPLGLATLGTGIDPPSQRNVEARRCRIDGEGVGSANAFADYLSALWLVPAMDGLFTGPASERRRFLDRLTMAIDHGHNARVSAMERSLRSRNRLLEQPNADPQWLDAIERETAELAVAVAAARSDTVRRLSHALAVAAEATTAFPAAAITLEGWMETALPEMPAIEVEDRYRATLRANRARDAAAGRTLDGPHLSDLHVIHVAKGTPAAQASTGEQKALLIRLVLAHARLIIQTTGTAPLLLLDEVVAHLDPGRRRALYAWLESLEAQVWMTGADPAAFADIAPQAQMVEIAPGRIAPLS
ncbi:MAG: DNA replication/repair protein RecF [Rhizobiales bacterium]|nr:DNA replication/repair protein RecF [Hyphomicrobiales bacterium]